MIRFRHVIRTRRSIHSMRSAGRPALAALVVVTLLSFACAAWCEGSARAASMGNSGGRDLDDLLSRAGKRFDLSREDAVVLLESRQVSIGGDGAERTRIHRVVYVGGSPAVRDHADLRIPYDSERSKLTVETLRTWRDGRWWPDASQVSPTAVVETEPFELASADDYTGMRETMLLHDGVALPCVLETAYAIEETVGDGGSDGLFVFSQRYPAVMVELVLTAKVQPSIAARYENGAPEPAVTQGTDGTFTYTWTMENVGALGVPAVAHPETYEPYVAWSTWPSWDALGRLWTQSFEGAASLEPALADTLRARLENEPSLGARARGVCAFVDETARSIHYDPRFWTFSPRPASRTYETAYGHSLDRAVFAAALFRESGLEAEPIYRTPSGGVFDADLPGLSTFESLCIHVTAGSFDAYYDPLEGKLTEGSSAVRGRSTWSPAGKAPSRPAKDSESEDPPSEFALDLTVEPDTSSSQGLHGTGYLRATGQFSPRAEMGGLGERSFSHLTDVVTSVLPGASVASYDFEVFDQDEIAAGFTWRAKSPKEDDRGRIALVIGDPAGGAASRLSSDVHAYNRKRTSPVFVPGGMAQRITVRLKASERKIVQRPQSHNDENSLGAHRVRVDEKNGWITISRELELRGGRVAPEEWPRLRALLLQDADPSDRTVLMK